MVYDNRHRAFLQAIMSGGIVEDEKARALCAQIFDEEDVDMSRIVSAINDNLSPIAMSCKSGTCEITGRKYWCVVGTAHEDSAVTLSEFSPGQRAFLRVVFSELVSSDNGCISSTECLNLAHNLEVKFTATDADLFLKKMTKNKWLHKHQGLYFMGIRSIIELMPYFRATYQENFHNCQLCKDIMFHGHKCEHCDKAYHFYCISRKIADLGEDKCPSCLNNMDCTEIIEFNNTQNPNQTEAPADTENGDEPMEVADDEVFSQPISAPRKSRRRTRAN